MFQVNDGDRVLRFEGVLLSHSTSFKDDADRWVEFDLYRTEGGSYVIGRTGYSRLFHAKGCDIVRKGRHRPAQVATLGEGSVPCQLCKPVVSTGHAGGRDDLPGAAAALGTGVPHGGCCGRGAGEVRCGRKSLFHACRTRSDP